MPYLKNNPLTAVLLVTFVLVALIGGVIVILHPETLTFESLLNDLEKFAVAIGIIGVGHGVAAAGQSIGNGAAANNFASVGSSGVPGLSEGIKAQGFEPSGEVPAWHSGKSEPAPSVRDVGPVQAGEPYPGDDLGGA
jgi:hypothetical protein